MQRPPSPQFNPERDANLVHEVIEQGLDRGATDIHFEPIDSAEDGLTVRFRIDGLLSDHVRIPRAKSEMVIGRLKVMASLLTYRIDIPQEGSIRFTRSGPGGAVDLRISSFPTVRGERVVVRVLPVGASVRSLAELGFVESQIAALHHAVEAPAGMVLLTGPAGAGKTTTAYALLTHIRACQPWRSIITVEDPVEQRIDGVTQIQIHPHGELNYERCMRSLLRQDPQVLMVGEIRDARTAEVAVEAALTGHVILTTMHSGSCAEAVLRLTEMGIAPYQVTNALNVVVNQRLLRRRVANPSGGQSPLPNPQYQGRIAAAHVVRLDDDLRAMIRNQPSRKALAEKMAHQAPDLFGSVAKLIEQKLTDTTEADRVVGCENPEWEFPKGGA